MFTVVRYITFVIQAVGKIPDHIWYLQPLADFLVFDDRLFQLFMN